MPLFVAVDPGRGHELVQARGDAQPLLRQAGRLPGCLEPFLERAGDRCDHCTAHEEVGYEDRRGGQASILQIL